ncbi:hypothetical protein N9L02_00015 [Gammaproteobacteria bacterium]|nr:hypothetical protein [Gammaproteobacteria bacterium]
MTVYDISSVKKKISALASQAYILATGLQNAAPPGTSGGSVQYLLQVSAELEKMSNKIDVLLGDNLNLQSNNRREL